MKRLLALSLFTLALHAADTYPVTGMFLDSVTQRPIPGARIILALDQRLDRSPSVVTGPDGAFSFRAPQGVFRLLAQMGDYWATLGERIAGGEAGTGVVTGPGLDTTNIRFLWYAAAHISGRVTDDHGEPVEGALVSLLKSEVVRGRRAAFPYHYVYTNDLGEYRFPTLNGGTYYISVSGEPWYTPNSFLPTAARPAAAAPPLAYASLFYPGVRDAAAARPLILKPGSEATADFTLAAVPGVRVTVRCNCLAQARNTVSLLSEGPLGSERYERTVTLAGDRILINGVAPGRYTVQAGGRDNGAAATIAKQVIDVGGADLDVTLTVRRLTSVSGTVSLARGAKQTGGLSVGLVQFHTGLITNVPVRADGTYQFLNVPEGKWVPTLYGVDGFLIESATAEGAPFRDGVLEILAPEQNLKLDIVANNATGSVTGHVYRAGKPVDTVLALLIPKQLDAAPSRGQVYQTDSDGSFTFQHVPSGDYYLVATEDPEPEYANPAVLKKLITGASELHVEPGLKYQERVNLP
jgi:hypothetical protein